MARQLRKPLSIFYAYCLMSNHLHLLLREQEEEVSDVVSEGDGVAISNSRSINTSVLELVDECLIVIGSHRGPAAVLDLGVENGY